MSIMLKTTKTMITMVLVSALLLQADASAIPMWEFLSREEKMTHLYRIFDKQAKEFCKDSMINDCYRNILLDGLQHLIYMDEYILDTLDPYQRDAHTQIWRSLVGSKLIENRIDDRVKNSYNNVDTLDTSDSDDNGLAEGSSSVNDYLNPASYGESHPSGPYIIRVYPDGRPVPTNGMQPKPYDDDLEELTYYQSSSITHIPISNERQYQEHQLPQTKELTQKNPKGFFNNGIKHDSLKNSIKFSRMIRAIESN